MKRALAHLLVTATMLIAGTAVAEPSGDPFDGRQQPIASDKTLSADEVIRYALPYLPRVAQCYRRHALSDRRATGELELYLVIARGGAVVHSEVRAPGLMVLRAAYLERCLKKEIAHWRFPPRAGFTNAVIPYFLLHTKAPGAGPFPGCRSANGCAAKEPARPRRQI